MIFVNNNKKDNIIGIYLQIFLSNKLKDKRNNIIKYFYLF